MICLREKKLNSVLWRDEKNNKLSKEEENRRHLNKIKDMNKIMKQYA